MQLYIEAPRLVDLDVEDTFVLIKLMKMAALIVDMVGASYFVYFIVFGWERQFVGKYKSIKLKRKKRKRRKYYRATRFHGGKPLLLNESEEERATIEKRGEIGNDGLVVGE